MTQPFKVYSDSEFYHHTPERKARNGLKYLSCRAKESSLDKVKVRGLIIHDSDVVNAACTSSIFEHFIIDGDSVIEFSHFTDVKFCQSGAMVDTTFKGNIFNSVLFHNIQFATTHFVHNAFINCVFSRCGFNNSSFSGNSFSGTVFNRNTVRNDKYGNDLSKFMVKCDFKPATVIGKWEEYRDSYPQLKNYFVRKNIRVINTGFTMHECIGLEGLEREHSVPKGFTSVDFNYDPAIALPAAPNVGGSKVSTKDTQPIAVLAPPKHRLKPYRFMSAGL